MVLAGLLLLTGCLAASAHAAGDASEPRLLGEQLGTASIKPDTVDSAARAWFAQGERLMWGFDEAEAARAFRKAQRLDPSCALCFWPRPGR